MCFHVISPSGQLLTDHKLINESFSQFYSELYASDTTASEEDITGVLQSLDMPTLTDASRLKLDADVTLEEIKTAICSSQWKGVWP